MSDQSQRRDEALEKLASIPSAITKRAREAALAFCNKHSICEVLDELTAVIRRAIDEAVAVLDRNWRTMHAEEIERTGDAMRHANQLAEELSTERAAREKAEVELRFARECAAENHGTLCAVTAALLNGRGCWTTEELLGAIRTLRQQLARAEKERDEARRRESDCRQIIDTYSRQEDDLNNACAERDSLRAKCEASESECLGLMEGLKTAIELKDEALALVLKTDAKCEALAKALEEAETFVSPSQYPDLLGRIEAALDEYRKPIS